MALLTQQCKPGPHIIFVIKYFHIFHSGQVGLLIS